MSFTKTVEQGCFTWNIPVSAEMLTQWERYVELLLEKNQVMNLTAITEPEEVAVRHILDCLFQLTCASFAGKKVIDIGSGGGFPGVPLQIAAPDARFTLLDSRKKRVDFLAEVSEKLGLPAEPISARAEEFCAQKGRRESYDLAVSRAVAPLNILCELCLPFVKVGGMFLAMKSDNEAAAEEIDTAKSAIRKLGGRLAECRAYQLNGGEIRHQMVLIQKEKPTPPAFPRRYAKIEASPL